MMADVLFSDFVYYTQELQEITDAS